MYNQYNSGFWILNNTWNKTIIFCVLIFQESLATSHHEVVKVQMILRSSFQGDGLSSKAHLCFSPRCGAAIKTETNLFIVGCFPVCLCCCLLRLFFKRGPKFGSKLGFTVCAPLLAPHSCPGTFLLHGEGVTSALREVVGLLPMNMLAAQR